ncbi:MAG: hypothetical protein ABIN37_06755 [Burkholderiaceae bacterium]
MTIRVLPALGLALFLSIPAAQAGILEDLLAVPAIQSLLGRVPELQATVQRCTDARYKQRNAGTCLQAENAARLARVPAELRAVLSVPASAASLRDLCLAVQQTKMQETYLCTELGKADTGFKTLIEQRRAAVEAAQMQNIQTQELGK